jgi:hypothetical protein
MSSRDTSTGAADISAEAFIAPLEALRDDEQRRRYEASFNAAEGDTFL